MCKHAPSQQLSPPSLAHHDDHLLLPSFYISAEQPRLAILWADLNIAFRGRAQMRLSSTVTVGHAKDSWNLHIEDAGVPPTMTATSSWVFLSFIAAVLFLEVRPAAIRRVRASAEPNACVIADDVDRSVHTRRLWPLLVAVWTCALYDVVHRTSSYCVLSAHMLARRRLLPLGNDFVWDGLWTEWVNSVRFYVFCVPSATTSAAPSLTSCADWKLPLAGTLAYDQYPEYAALNVSSPATPSEVRLYHKVCLASLAITWVAVVALHGQYALLRRLFGSAASSGATRSSKLVTDELALARDGQAMCTHDLTTAIGATEAPGDDSWVDSPEAIAEEARWRQQDEHLGLQRGSAHPMGVSADAPASPTSHLVWQCWPSLATAVYATLYAYVGGLPLFMIFLFPVAILIVMTVLVTM
ncbi:conserved hypothetical protein [Leishmania mexicana MHOM/GT/2001/U1103]|uniref:Uncharacterized protein n=1 Tax=Leishmania mexicana (strain MHOM/GT/2001/U1103) TaxID=929439 RepID=E9B2P2_LEIMU|nr:conserved hypothetical protein [Leishmania mexicana MHOM/GT/2001/U1103]CBZ29505.1 conserved hypothetical protein [Leishmania mexicana MHOM/GT/2001/U1103]